MPSPRPHSGSGNGLARARPGGRPLRSLVRGSGVGYDIRRAEPYSSYEDFDFKVPVEREGTASRAIACGW